MLKTIAGWAVLTVLAVLAVLAAPLYSLPLPGVAHAGMGSEIRLQDTGDGLEVLAELTAGAFAAQFVKEWDADGDGRISAVEFPGPEEHFAELDADGDGYVSAAEAPDGPPHDGPGREPDSGGSGRGRDGGDSGGGGRSGDGRR